MSLHINVKWQMAWYGMVCQMSNVIAYQCQMSWHINVKCQMSWNINAKCQMSKFKSQMIKYQMHNGKSVDHVRSQ